MWGSNFVEVGCWFGKSICFAAEYAQSLDKEINFYAVDTFLGSTSEKEQEKIIKENGGSIFRCFVSNAKVANGRITPVACDSRTAAKHFTDHSVEFCFIDAAHDFKSVVQDISAWMPKVSWGGTIAGHDWHLQTVRNAVKEFWGDVEVDAKQNCWMKRL